MRLLTIFFAVVVSLNLYAQVGQNLLTHLSFNKNGCAIVDESGDPNIDVLFLGDSICGCGVAGNSRYFDGDGDYFYLFGNDVESAFATKDFSLSFYFKPTSANIENQVLFSKKMGCTGDQAFAIRYNPANRSMNVELAESPTKRASLSRTLPFSCWYHVVVVRKGGVTQLYVNKQKIGEVNAPGGIRINCKNSEPMSIGRSACNLEKDFEGYLDEIRLYERALSLQDVEAPYFSPDQIATGLKPNSVNDTTIYLGGSVPIEVTTNCPSNSFSWSPVTDLDTPDQPNPIATPTVTTTYTLTIIDAELCRSLDSVRIEVIDPSTVVCGDIMLPTAFTPNGDGPAENDSFGISNPFVAGELITFEIFDRWGNIVYSTNNILDKWDGS